LLFARWAASNGPGVCLQLSAFINDVLDRYQAIAADRPGEENTLKFYQMDVRLAAAEVK